MYAMHDDNIGLDGFLIVPQDQFNEIKKHENDKYRSRIGEFSQIYTSLFGDLGKYLKK
jgi:hypothetical protein